MTAYKRLGALVLVALTLGVMVLGSGMARDSGGGFSLPELETETGEVPEGYTQYDMESDGSPVRFFAPDTAQVKQHSSSVTVYPVDGVFTEANVNIRKSAWETTDDLDTVMESSVSYYFDSYGAQYIAEPTHFDGGNYSYDMVELQYTDDGELHTLGRAIFASDGYYWYATADFTDEYADQTIAAFSDVLSSLCVNGDDPASDGPAALYTGGVIVLLDMTEGQDNFYDSEYLDPIGYVKDLPGGGQMLVTLYEMAYDNGGFLDYSVYTDAWLIGDGSAVLLGHNELYKEVGGNSGSVSVGEKDGVVYVELEAHLWEGDRFNNYYGYLPVDEQAASFGEGVYMEAYGTVGEEDQGEYIIGGEHCPKSDFDIARSAYVPDGEMPMDIQVGHGNGSVMDFDGLRHWYPD